MGLMGYFGFSWSWIFLPQYFLLVCLCRESWWGHCPWIVFTQIYFTFFTIYASRLRFCAIFQCGLVFCVWSVFLNPMLSILPESLFNCSQIKTDLWGCRKGKKYLINCIWLHIFVKWDQKNVFTVPSIDRGPPTPHLV